ncbi:MAG: trypsin-like peptidase domain-containing protein [Bacillales bacterium]|nr:trypsin-like peptidase domain-containing protein [Bacillales bacterium]
MEELDIAYSTVKLYVKLKDGNSSVATSFFYKYSFSDSERLVLITNRHVLNNSVEVTFYLHTSFKVPGLTRKFTISGNDINLIIKSLKNGEDLCALDIGRYMKDDAYRYFQEKDFLSEEDYDKKNVMQNVFIAGYPVGLEDSVNKLPVFTNGMTATSLDIDYSGHPLIMINALALPGSSGSPVFIRGKNGNKLVGIIVGGDEDNKGQIINGLCYAIKAGLIKKIEMGRD